jgi:cyclic-di-AMP phosphodiesterase PgpH
MNSSTQVVRNNKGHQKRAKFTLLVVTAILTVVILNAPLSIRSGAFSLQAGDVAVQDILATKSFSYTSNILTEKARLQARNSTPAVYLPADPVVKKQQIETLNDIFAFIDQVRADSYAQPTQMITDLAGISSVTLSEDTRQNLVDWSETRWTAVQLEARQVLDESLRNTIRVDNVESIRRNLDSKINVAFSTDQVNAIHQLVVPLIIPNSLLSEELTKAAQDDTAASVLPIVRNFVTGQIIVQHGQIVLPEDLEALEIAGLANKDTTLNSLLASIALVIILAVFVGLYLYRRRAHPLDDLRSLVLVALVFVLFLLIVRFVIPYRTILPFIFPVAAFGLTLATAFNLEIGLMFALVLSILAGYNLPGSLEITVYYIIGSMTGILVLGRGRRISGFFWSSIGITAANIAVILAYRLGDPATDWLGLATLGGAAVTNGLASASLTLILQYIFSQALGITTALQLLEISRPDHPLMQFLLRNAPGTYQHSLQVSNLAEQAAEKINADSLLVRVGALYHDVGKAVNPQFFIENQVKGKENPHDEIDPTVSATIIISHVRDGITLGKKYRLAPRILDFMAEHHGTMLTRYQYNQAKEAANGLGETIDEKFFRYPGPAPRSRETALLMLADGCEARARAELPKDETELRSLVQKVIDYAMKEKQLDRTKISLDDLSKINDSFVATLMGVYHQRIIYPETIQTPDSDPVI